MTKIILPMFLAVLGALLGLFSTMLISFRHQRQNVIMKLLDQYLEVRKHVVEVVSDLANLSDLEQMDPVKRGSLGNSVSKLFYMHFDFLPKPVLDALILLNVSLHHPEGGPYCVINNTILPMPKTGIPPFVEQCSLSRNAKINAILALSGGSSLVRTNTVIKLHARTVLFVMNDFSTADELLQLEKQMRKAVRTDVGLERRGRFFPRLRWTKRITRQVTD